MIPCYRLAVFVLVTVIINSRYALCTHFDANSVPNWRADRLVRANNNVSNIQNSFSVAGGGDRSNVNLVNFPPPTSSSPLSALSSSYSITPSLSYQFHTNDHEHLDKIVLAHHNSVRNGFSAGASPTDSDYASGSVTTGKIVESKRNGDGSGGKGSGVNLPANHGVNSNNNPSPTFDLSAYQAQQQQQQEPVADAHRIKGGDWNGKQQQQQPWLYRQTTLPAISNGNSFHSQNINNGQVGKKQQQKPNGISSHDNTNKLVSQNDRFKSAGNNATYQEKSEGKNPSLQYESRKDTPTSFVYSSRLSNGNPAQHYASMTAQTHPLGVASSYNSPYSGIHRTQVNSNRVPLRQNGSQKKRQPIRSQGKKKKSGKRKILASRADTYAADDEEEEEDDAEEEDVYQNHYHHDHRQGLYEGEKEEGMNDQEDVEQEEEDDESNYYYPPDGEGDGENPEIRDIGAPGDPGAHGFVPPPGALPPGPFPPPPPPLKGTVDYILIPLILIGIAAPIFVVLYVILGGFEYKLAPIARSFKSSAADYQPYIDSVTSSVGRALEKYECYEYTSCRLRRLYDRIGFSSDTTSSIEESLNAVTPKEYGPIVSKAFSSLTQKARNDEMCSSYKCSDMVEYFL